MSTQSRPVDRNFFLRKLHSLSGVVPVGVYVLFHLYANSFSHLGPTAYNGVVNTLRSTPYLLWIELFFILLPIAFHGLYGFYITAQATNNLSRYSYTRNWFFYLQRWSGAIAFVFILYHVFTLRFGEYVGMAEPSFETMTAYLSNAWIFAFYIVGVVSTVFHLANGLWLFGVNWGILVSPRAQRVAAQVMGVFFVLVSALGVNALLPFVR